ncbi:MAG TPA: single-stranded-DNA-specific exonuclease RecJ [Anaerolineaceae bacterium]|nr:single-stranded-DNA-specific exonuclease RecJ [Anaerolineaceae bacterium]
MLLPIKKRWLIAKPIPAEIDEKLNDYSPVLRKLLFNRGISNSEQAETYLNAYGTVYDPFELSGMEAAIDRIALAIRTTEPIAVYGDYDVDGVTATAVLVQVISRLGGNVREYIPNRFHEGYGVNKEALKTLCEAGVKLVVTVDCGIRSPEEADYCKKIGLDLIISDHHDPLNGLPDAISVICPKQDNDKYPDKNLAGVGLAFKIAEAYLKKYPSDGIHAEDWLDLVAVGTVADIVPMTGENRSLVRAGLKELRAGMRQGLISLAGVAGLNIKNATARDIGFVLGPRLNAAGRLESALDAYRLLISMDINESGLLAQNLENQNHKRQEQTQLMQQIAEREGPIADSELLMFSVSPEFKMGIVGLVASRLTETYYRPSVVAAQEEGYTRASCRSIPEFNITKALDECTSLLMHHGGHAMAAGFTVDNRNLAELTARLKEIAGRELGELDLRPVLKADMEIPLRELRPELLKDIDALEPTGLANPEAQFISRDLQIVRCKAVGNENQHLRMTVTDGRITYDAIAFRQGAWAEKKPEHVDLFYTYERNSFQGKDTLQLNVKDIRLAGCQD